jgi:hypothetical protein
MAGVSFEIDTSEPADVKLRMDHLKIAFDFNFHHVAAFARCRCDVWAINLLNTAIPTHTHPPPTPTHHPHPNTTHTQTPPTVQLRTNTDDNCALPRRVKGCSGGR